LDVIGATFAGLFADNITIHVPFRKINCNPILALQLYGLVTFQVEELLSFDQLQLKHMHTHS
jgi:hypothetical protein